MVAGRLQVKKDYYYIVLSYKNNHGKRKEKWFRTGLKIKNKRLTNKKVYYIIVILSPLERQKHNIISNYQTILRVVKQNIVAATSKKHNILRY